jgi:hypothetical protein
MILAGNSEGKRSLGRPTLCWVDNIKMDLRGVKWGGMDWTELVQDRALVNMIINLRNP